MMMERRVTTFEVTLKKSIVKKHREKASLRQSLIPKARRRDLKTALRRWTQTLE
jgi:hypothetical protein